MYIFIFFFFSSRRRHTRLQGDWSSDVCSSDLDAIRIPMMVLAFLGAVLNLYVVGKVRRLRSRPASQWRQQPVTKKKLNSERFQIALSVLTLLLLAAEWITHPIIHRVT